MRHYFQEKSLKEGKRERTRSLLLDGAIAAIADHGPQGTSIKEITAYAGVSNGTFYNHFTDLDEVFQLAAYAVAKELAEEIAASVAGVDNGLKRIVVSTDAFIDRAVSAPNWGKMISSASHNLESMRLDIAANLREDVALAIKQGQLSDQPSNFVLHQIGALIVLGIVVQIAKGRDADITADTCRAVLQLLGLTPAQAARAVRSYLPTHSS